MKNNACELHAIALVAKSHSTHLFCDTHKYDGLYSESLGKLLYWNEISAGR